MRPVSRGRSRIMNKTIVYDKWVKMPDLTEADIALCKLYAAIRTISARRNGQKRPFSTGGASHVMNDEIGLIAEHTFCKHVNVFHDLVFGGRDEGYDCIVQGHRVDVKAIQKPEHNLLIKRYPHVTEKVDQFVLVYVNIPETWIVGWIKKDCAVQPENMTTLPEDDCYLIKQKNLNCWHTAKKNQV
jgi:hypothetical protein